MVINITSHGKFNIERFKYVHNNVWKFFGDRFGKQMILTYNPLKY